MDNREHLGNGASRPSAPVSQASWLAGLVLAGAVLAVQLLGINRPGLTVDEPINVGHGKTMVTALATRANRLPLAVLVDGLWRRGHEHPPLARFLLGCSHRLFDPHPRDPDFIVPQLGRPASALAFAGIVLLCTRLGWSLAGPVAGIVAGLAVVLMPRVYAHGNLASPEVISAFFFLAALTSAAWSLTPVIGKGRLQLRITRLLLAASSWDWRC